MTKLKLTGGRVYDPASKIDGEIKTLWIAAGKFVAEPSLGEQSEFQNIDVAGRVVMPGGVDMHSHIVGPKVNAGRKMQPELYVADYLDNPGHVRGRRILPTIEDTALSYLGMGYTTVMDAAVSPLASRHVHAELERFPILDAGFFAMVGNNRYFLQAAASKDVRGTAEFLKWLLVRCRALAPKLVNPGGVESWKAGRAGNAFDLDDKVIGFATTPREILTTIVTAANELGLPHPAHIHCNNLGMPGNWTTTAATMAALAGLRAHLTHIQFHSYGGSNPDEIFSQVDPLADIVNENPLLSVDVGQVLFGETTSMTGDGPLGHFLSQINGKKWYSADTEVESGCGVSPIKYSDRKALNCWQWLIGLEWYLKVCNPWQVVMSTDHPNGASFLAYPHIIRLLMDREFRKEQVSRLPTRVRDLCDLANLTREYSLSEICIITRAGPARLLGLRQKGCLSIGADADVTIYTENQNREVMFQMPWLVIKDGWIVVRDHELVGHPKSKTWVAAADSNQDSARWKTWFESNYSMKIERFGVTEKTDFFSRQHEVA